MTNPQWVDAPAGWHEGDPLPQGATPITAAALNSIQSDITAEAAARAAADAAEAGARAAAITAEANARTAADAALKGLIKLPLSKFVQVIPSVNNGATPTLNREYCVGFLLGPQTIDRIACSVSSGGSAGAVIRLGLRSESDGSPGPPVADATIDATTTGWKQATVNYAHPGGVLYVTWTSQGWTTTAPVMDGGQVTGNPFLPAFPFISASSRAAIDFANGHTPIIAGHDGVSGALPNSWTCDTFTTLPAITLVMRRSA